jgi:hypothetical protein
MTRPRCRPPRLSPIFLLAIRRYQSYYFSHIRKKAKNRGTTTHTWYNLDCHAPQTQAPQWNPEKTTTNSVLWACVVQAVNKSKKNNQKKLARGERNKGLEDLKIGHFFSHPVFSLTYHLLKK